MRPTLRKYSSMTINSHRFGSKNHAEYILTYGTDVLHLEQVVSQNDF